MNCGSAILPASCVPLALEDIQLFAFMSGDVNPAHVDREFAKSDMFHKVIAHGMWAGALIQLYLAQSFPVLGRSTWDRRWTLSARSGWATR